MFPANKIALLFILYCFCFSIPGFSQSTRNAQAIRPDNGLSHRNVLCVLQDRRGLMWFGTQYGLNRYDGRDFLVLNTTSNIAKLSGNVIELLFEDSKGFLWAATDQGLDRINPEDFSIKHFINPVTANRQEDRKINAIYEDISGRIWISKRSGEMYVAENSQDFKSIFSLSKQALISKDYNIVGFIEEAKNTFFITSQYSGIFKLNQNGKVLKHYKITGKILKGPIKTSLYSTTIFTTKGIYKYISSRDSFILAEADIYENTTHYLETRNNSIWFVTNFVNLYCVENGTLHDKSNILAAIDEKELRVQSLYEDKGHNLWVATNYGIIKLPLHQKLFTGFLNYETRKDKSSRISLRGIYEMSDHDIFIGSYRNLYRRNYLTGEIDSFTPPQIIYNEKTINSTYAMVHDGGNLWLATEGNGIVKLNIATKKYIFFEYFNFKKNRLTPRYFISIAKDGSGVLWLGCYEGLYFKSKQKDSFYSYAQLFPKSLLNSAKIYAFLEDGNSMWIASDKGLFLVNTQNLKIEKYYANLIADKNSFTEIVGISKDKNGNLCLGTKGNGLIKFNIKTGKINQWTTAEGLADNTVYASIFEGSNIWISTNNGLSYLDIEKNAFHNFYMEDGLTDNEFNHGSFLKTHDGKIYFGTINGGNIFDPAQISRNRTTFLPLLLTQVEKFNKKTDKIEKTYAGLNSIGEIILPYENRFFNIHFALADYTRADKNQYLYFLEGIDKAWNYLGNQNIIRMAGLPAGEYILHIKAISSNGQQASNELKIPIISLEVFYKTWWFMLFVIIVAGCLVYIVYRYRINEYKKTIKLRTRIASDLHDEVGSQLTYIALSSDLMKESDAGKENKFIERIAQSSRKAIATMSDVVWSIDSRSDNFGSLIDRMHDQCRELFEPSGIHYKINATGIELSKKLKMDTRHNLYLIFKEACNNIAKHSKANNVFIELKNANGLFEMHIKDDGQKSGVKSKTGQGLKNMQMRAKQLNGKIHLSQENGYHIHFTGKIIP